MPGMDRLCREGTICRNHYSNAPICVPARYSIITGTYPHHHGATDNVQQWVPDGSPMMMESLREAGYHTVGVGKIGDHLINLKNFTIGPTRIAQFYNVSLVHISR